MNNPNHDGVEVLTISNTVMKDVAKAENAFTSNETVRYQYMLWEGRDGVVIVGIIQRTL